MKTSATAHIHQPRRGLLAPCMLAAMVTTGCGGGSNGSDAAAPALASPRSVAAAATVRLEGCVVSSDWTGMADTAVHARTADGRAVGTAFSDTRGVFVLTVPARSAIVLDTAVAGPGGLTLTTGTRALSVAGCLLAPQ
jgi:hypothetical protein